MEKSPDTDALMVGRRQKRQNGKPASLLRQQDRELERLAELQALGRTFYLHDVVGSSDDIRASIVARLRINHVISASSWFIGLWVAQWQTSRPTIDLEGGMTALADDFAVEYHRRAGSAPSDLLIWVYGNILMLYDSRNCQSLSVLVEFLRQKGYKVIHDHPDKVQAC